MPEIDQDPMGRVQEAAIFDISSAPVSKARIKARSPRREAHDEKQALTMIERVPSHGPSYTKIFAAATHRSARQFNLDGLGTVVSCGSVALLCHTPARIRIEQRLDTVLQMRHSGRESKYVTGTAIARQPHATDLRIESNLPPCIALAGTLLCHDGVASAGIMIKRG